MKSTFFSTSAALAATLLALSSSVSADVEPQASSLTRRHHAKVARANEAHMLEKRAFKGKATWYGVQPGDMGACGTHLNADDYFVALNEGQYGSLNAQSSFCGKKITITNGIKTTQATVLDACPKGVQCHWGALDMSRSLFSFFNDFGVGVFDITWWVTGQGNDSGSSSSSSSSNNDSSDKNDDSDSKAADKAAEEKAAKQRAADKKAAEEKKEAAEKKKKEEEEAKEKKEKKEAAEKKKKEEAKEKKEEAKKKKEEAKKKAQEKIHEAQNQNIAAFGEIMQQLNAMVESAVDNGTSA